MTKVFRLSLILCVLLVACKKLTVVPQWGIYENEIRSEKDYQDPFRDVDLLVKVIRPDSSVFNHYGFFDGENTWRFRIMPDMEGRWKYRAVFSDSSKVIDGEFICIKSGKSGPLAPLAENPVWTVFTGSKQAMVRSFHTGDRLFASNFSDSLRNEFLDWLGEQGYNMISVGSHYLNRRQPGRGEGWKTPELWPLDTEEYGRMEAILLNLEKRNIYVHPFAGFFGRAAEWPVDHAEQELFIKYTLARLSSFRNIILNVGGPEPLLKPKEYQDGNMTAEDINRVAMLIKKYDPYNHMLSVHNRTGNEKGDYERDPFIFEPWEDYSTLQGGKSTDLNDVYNFIVQSRKAVKPVFAHEVMWYGNMYHEGLNTESLGRKTVTLLMAGAFINFGDMNGNSSSGFSGCLDPDSANVEAHRIFHTVIDIVEKLPYHELTPFPEMSDGAFCLSNGKGKNLFYAPDGKSFIVNIKIPSKGRWINPRSGEEKNTEITEKSITPPDNAGWLLWVDDSNN